MKASWKSSSTSWIVRDSFMRKRRMMNQINVVPYIDVMLVLLVIFMVTAPMTNPGVVELPKVGQSLKQKIDPIVISVKKNSKIEVNGKLYKKDSLLVFLKKKIEKNSDQSIVIAADEKVKYGTVISLMDLLKQNEFNKVGLLLKPE
jgi:biopolymer transport protein TolR